MSTVRSVADALRGRILRGELRPGQRLPQDVLAAELGVSKIPLREALNRLAAEGLVVFESNRGSIVRTLTPETAEEVYGLRRVLEPALLARAVPRLTIVHLAEAELALAHGDGRSAEANWRFHRALYAASGWERGLALLESLFTVVAPYVAFYTEGLGAGGRSSEEHAALLRCCAAGDVGGALAVVTDHLQGAEQALLAHLEGSRHG